MRTTTRTHVAQCRSPPVYGRRRNPQSQCTPVTSEVTARSETPNDSPCKSPLLHCVGHKSSSASLTRRCTRNSYPDQRALLDLLSACPCQESYTYLQCVQTFHHQTRRYSEAPLPSHRMVLTNPFKVVGVDFAEPLLAHTQDGDTKCCVTLFTFAMSRAIHLELVSSMTSESFILCL